MTNISYFEYIKPFIAPSVTFILGIIPYLHNRHLKNVNLQSNVDKLLDECGECDKKLSKQFSCYHDNPKMIDNVFFFELQDCGTDLIKVIKKLCGYYDKNLLPYNSLEDFRNIIIKNWEEVIPNYNKMLNIISKRLNITREISLKDEDNLIIVNCYKKIKKKIFCVLPIPQQMKRLLRSILSFLPSILYFFFVLFVAFLINLSLQLS